MKRLVLCQEFWTQGKFIYSETYIHCKTLAVLDPGWAMMTGGSANIAFTSMWFHSEMNIALTDADRIRNWVAQLWSEHLQISLNEASQLLAKPDDAFALLKQQADDNLNAMAGGLVPKGRVFPWEDIEFPKREFDRIVVDSATSGSKSD